MSGIKSTEEIFNTALQVGQKRLEKTPLETAVSGFIAGIYVTFGGLAALTVSAIITEVSGFHDLGWLMGSMVYPIGFIFVVIGQSELFTENFVTPVLAAWEGEGRYYQLFRLWLVALVFNVLGVLVFTYCLGVGNVISGETPARTHVIQEFQWVSEHVFAEPFSTFFWKAIIGGLLINFMSWLVIASDGTTARLIMIWIPTFLIMLLGAHHCIVGSSEILLGIYYGSNTTVAKWFVHYLLPAALGNGVGGIVFVAALHYVQFSPRRLFFRD